MRWLRIRHLLDPYFVLEGPTRAVMFSDVLSDPLIIEVDLKVKGATESEDGYLSFLVSPLTCSGMLSRVFKCAYTTKHSRLEFSLGHIVSSVEATIFVRVIDGSWPHGLHGLFTVSTTGFSDRNTTKYSAVVGHERIALLDSGGQEVPIAGDGKIKLSRNVISTENCGEVIFQVKALEGDIKVVEKDTIFHPLEASKSISELDMGFCKMEVTVFWSRVSCNP
ncbi:hypothetical protein BDA96_03G229200 [Sorghum bicolor]|uniref:DUF6598 domain-containing protein n=1 Tax=Sorghum bicolor TaxID=4558 RepID=A0A921UNK4_SORBI|nr:hypothetical protein BDA96_03G229200 [Sorghum bicolor]